MRLRLLLAVVVAALTLTATSTAALPVHPAWLPQIYYAIGTCETSLNWHYHTRDYQGAFGFYRGTWDQYKPKGFPADADLATPRQQLTVAEILVSKFGYSPWGCYRNGDYAEYMGH